MLALREVPVPEPKRREVLIRVAAAGVNRADLLLQAERAPVPAGWNVTPGLEVSGVIEATGPAVTRHAIGDRVMALTLGGGYADYCTVDERLVLDWPDVLSAEQAAGVPEAAATVWTSLIDRGRPRRAERVLVNGGASTIGALSIAVAAHLGCVVVATAGSDEKCAAAVSAGASCAVNYRAGDLVERLRAGSNGMGFDLVLDMAGGDTLTRNLEVLAAGGRIVVIGMMAGRTATIDLLPLMAKRASLLGSTLFFRSLPQKGVALAKGWRCLAPLLDRPGGLPLFVDEVFELEAAAAAQRRMDAPDHRGKVVIRP